MKAVARVNAEDARRYQKLGISSNCAVVLPPQVPLVDEAWTREKEGPYELLRLTLRLAGR